MFCLKANDDYVFNHTIPSIHAAALPGMPVFALMHIPFLFLDGQTIWIMCVVCEFLVDVFHSPFLLYFISLLETNTFFGVTLSWVSLSSLFGWCYTYETHSFSPSRSECYCCFWCILLPIYLSLSRHIFTPTKITHKITMFLFFFHCWLCKSSLVVVAVVSLSQPLTTS